MAAKPERQPGTPAHSGEPIQRLHAQEVPRDWLSEVEHQDMADNVDRLQGDADLVTSLALAKYEGPLWDYFSNELAKYGYAVIKSWVATKVIFARCKQKGFGLRVLDRDFKQEEIEGLANYTVAKALHYFRANVLMKRRWDPTKGASLRTFFIGQCIFQFPNIYRDWLEEDERSRRHGFTDDMGEVDFHLPLTAPVERQVIATNMASQAMAEIRDPRVRRAMRMTADGFPQADIARVLGVSTKTVERMLANERVRQLRQKGVG